MATCRVLSDFTKAAILSLTVVFVSSNATEDMLGTTVLGTFSVRVQVRVPVIVPFTKLLQVMVQMPLVALGISLARDKGGVQLTDAPTLVAITPLALPNQYEMVCVVVVLCRLV